MNITASLIRDPRYEVSDYSRLFGRGCWSMTILPALWVDKHFEFKQGEFGTGKLPGLHVLRISFCWIFWQMSFTFVWDRNAGH